MAGYTITQLGQIPSLIIDAGMMLSLAGDMVYEASHYSPDGYYLYGSFEYGDDAGGCIFGSIDVFGRHIIVVYMSL